MNIKKLLEYFRYIFLKVRFFVSLKSFPGDIKNSYKNWIYFSILKSKYKRFLQSYPAVLNEKHEYSDFIWWLWFQGEQNAPEICKACLHSLRKNYPEKKIIILSNENINNYVDFPDFIIEKHKQGFISDAHFSDLLRLQLLIKYGGIWVDSTVYFTNRFSYAFEIPLFVFRNNERADPSCACSSWFISAEKNNPILVLTRNLLFDYWKRNKYLFHYFLFHFFLTIASEKYSEEWNAIPFFSNLPSHILQREMLNPFSEKRFSQIKAISDVHKLSYKYANKRNLKNSFLDYILENEK